MRRPRDLLMDRGLTEIMDRYFPTQMASSVPRDGPTEPFPFPADLNEDLAELVRIWSARNDRAAVLNLEALRKAIARYSVPLAADRPPPLAAPSSRLPSYRPRG